MNWFKNFIVVIGVISLLILGACSVPETTSVPETVMVETPEEQAQAQTTEENAQEPAIEVVEATQLEEPEDTSLEFTDATGKEISLAAAPEKIIVAGKATPYVLDTIYLFPEAAKKLIALEVRGFDTQAFLELVDPEVGVKAMLERDSGPEQIAPYNPDLVIVKNISLGGLGSTLEEISIPVMGVNLESPEYFYQDIQALGMVFDDSARANQIVAYYQGIDQHLKEALGNIPQEEVPSVLVLQTMEDGGEVTFAVPPASYLQTTLVQNAGGNPIWLDVDGGGSSWIMAGLEQIAVWNPDMVFVINYDGDSAETANQLLTSPTWAGLKAVENQQIYGFPADYASWDLIDPRWILGQQWLATIIQPERTTDINITSQVMSFYQEMYGLSEEQVNEFIMPRLDEIK